ncbi:hypothetical protein Pyrfu_1258 [Pyrolobus fumarii 1A]|uniref:Uncharacterized protein n=1 Tax=Pyrolobus fumarii (strain DSM 11204 / 1A) TaxID=694429 RepID=G0EG92_PYRF1|nr:hypothetical protein [Pyrolobus fumarii]AEM39117.1 hypothetical protein Pyrfu_1258 [Pyrolobus fumarii 1A]
MGYDSPEAIQRRVAILVQRLESLLETIEQVKMTIVEDERNHVSVAVLGRTLHVTSGLLSADTLAREAWVSLLATLLTETSTVTRIFRGISLAGFAMLIIHLLSKSLGIRDVPGVLAAIMAIIGLLSIAEWYARLLALRDSRSKAERLDALLRGTNPEYKRLKSLFENTLKQLYHLALRGSAKGAKSIAGLGLVTYNVEMRDKRITLTARISRA